MSKIVELLLKDDVSDGLIIGSIDNWEGKSISISRNDIDKSDIDELNLPGVYFLICYDEITGDDKVYIGEALKIKKRLKEHIQAYNNQKELFYWSKAICFVGEKLDKALIRYMENELVKEARASGAIKVLTSKTYDDPLTRNQIVTAKNYLSNLRILLGALNQGNILDSGKNKKIPENVKILHCKGNGALASGYYSSNGFTVIKDSTVSNHIVPSLKIHNKPYYELRNALEKDGIIVNGIFNCNYEFRSPSAAATVIIGNNASGKEKWR